MQKFRNRSSGIADILFSKSPTILDDDACRISDLDQNGDKGCFDLRRACAIGSGALGIGQRHRRMGSQIGCSDLTSSKIGVGEQFPQG